MDWQTSILRIKLNPGSSALTLLDWGALVQPFSLPWEQSVEVDPLVGAAWSWMAAKGNIQRRIRFQTQVQHASIPAMFAYQLSADAAWASALGGQTYIMEIRVLAQPDPGGTEKARTSAVYRAAKSVLVGHVSEPVPVFLRTTHTFDLQCDSLVAYTDP
jgi:hypothetical protein